MNEPLCAPLCPRCLGFSIINLCDFRHMRDSALNICSLKHGSGRHTLMNTGSTVGLKLPNRSAAALWNERDTPCI